MSHKTCLIPKRELQSPYSADANSAHRKFTMAYTFGDAGAAANVKPGRVFFRFRKDPFGLELSPDVHKRILTVIKVYIEFDERLWR